MREKKLPKDLVGNTMSYKEQNKAKRNYKQDKKPWNFPFREAFERAGVIDKAK